MDLQKVASRKESQTIPSIKILLLNSSLKSSTKAEMAFKCSTKRQKTKKWRLRKYFPERSKEQIRSPYPSTWRLSMKKQIKPPSRSPLKGVKNKKRRKSRVNSWWEISFSYLQRTRTTMSPFLWIIRERTSSKVTRTTRLSMKYVCNGDKGRSTYRFRRLRRCKGCKTIFGHYRWRKRINEETNTDFIYNFIIQTLEI